MIKLMSKEIMVNSIERKRIPKKWIPIVVLLVLIIIFTIAILQRKQPIKPQSSSLTKQQQFNSQIADMKQKYETTKNIPQPTPAEQLQIIETQIKSQKNPSSNTNNLDLYVQAAILAHQLGLSSAKQYALTALNLMPKDPRSRDAVAGSINSMQIISKGN